MVPVEPGPHQNKRWRLRQPTGSLAALGMMRVEFGLQTPIQAPVLNRFRQTRGADVLLPGQVGDRAGHAQHVVVRPRAQIQLAHRPAQQPPPSAPLTSYLRNWPLAVDRVPEPRRVKVQVECIDDSLPRRRKLHAQFRRWDHPRRRRRRCQPWGSWQGCARRRAICVPSPVVGPSRPALQFRAIISQQRRQVRQIDAATCIEIGNTFVAWLTLTRAVRCQQ
jgi:hypothetical protein